MKIYTKRGDQGVTDLIRKRVGKDDLRISSIGAVDEVMATILMAKQKISQIEVKEELDKVYDMLMSVCHEIALGVVDSYKISDDVIKWLEGRIDYYDSLLPPIREFIKLDKNEAAAWINIARVTTRRSERQLVSASINYEFNKNLLSFLNRLSDYFFNLGRYLNQ
jgi:cob(I)alamin adenosyltransferase